MKILSIDTSCDETSVAVTDNTRVLSNIIWSQASLHAKFGGVMPSLAQREHESRIDWVVNRAIKYSQLQTTNLDAIAVTVGPGLAIALGVGINKAKVLAKKYNKPLIAVNHLEGHLLSCLAEPKTEISKSKFLISKQNKNIKFKINNLSFPSMGLVVSGGNTQLILIEKLGRYKIIAETQDDALGEALDKAARILGLGYPGGAILEQFAKKGNPKAYNLPVPLMGKEDRQIFSYSGLKTAFYRVIEQTTKSHGLNKMQIYNLAASYQEVAFKHLIRVVSYSITHTSHVVSHLFVGGGVAANVELRKRIRKMCREYKINPLFPYSNKLYGDNAAMVGVVAYFKAKRNEFVSSQKIDRVPDFKLD